jgi:hypothetical protein
MQQQQLGKLLASQSSSSKVYLGTNISSNPASSILHVGKSAT